MHDAGLSRFCGGGIYSKCGVVMAALATLLSKVVDGRIRTPRDDHRMPSCILPCV